MAKRNYARRRNNTLWLCYDPDKVRAKHPDWWEDEGKEHPGVVFGAYTYEKVHRAGQLAGETFGDCPELSAPSAVIVALVGDWTLLEDEPGELPRFAQTPTWPEFSAEGLAARRDILLKLDALDTMTLVQRANGGLYLTEEERGN